MGFLARLLKAYKAIDGIAYDIMKIIKKLYKIEEIIAEENFSIKQIEEQRNKSSRPLIEQMHARLLKEENAAVYPKSTLGQAISYTLREWPRLVNHYALHVHSLRVRH